MKAFVLTFFEGDREVIHDYVRSFREMTPSQLAEAYNREHKIGITGVRRQGLWLFAMHQVFKERFGESPIILNDIVIELTDPIELVDGKISYLKENPYRHKEIPDPPTAEELMLCEKVRFTYQPVIAFEFFCLVLQIDSSNRISGDVVSFLDTHLPWGIVNKDIVAMTSMSCPGPEIGGLIEEVLSPAGYTLNEDYAVIQDDCPPDLNARTRRQVFLPNSSCRDIPWLGSVVTDGGNFIWYRDRIFF